MENKLIKILTKVLITKASRRRILKKAIKVNNPLKNN